MRFHIYKKLLFTENIANITRRYYTGVGVIIKLKVCSYKFSPYSSDTAKGSMLCFKVAISLSKNFKDDSGIVMPFSSCEGTGPSVSMPSSSTL